MKFIDFFSGVGGFTRGMELAGHECVGHCEVDKYAEASRKRGYSYSNTAHSREDGRLKMITNEKILMYAKSYLKEGLKGIDLTIEKNGGKAEKSLKRLRSDIQVEIKCIEEKLKHETATDENNMQWRPITILKKEKGSIYIKEKASELPHPLENVLLTDGKHVWIESLSVELNKEITCTAWMPLPEPYKEVKK